MDLTGSKDTFKRKSINLNCSAVLLAMLMFMLAGCDSSTNQQADASVHIERANAYKSQGQFRAAEIELRNAIKKSEKTAAPLLDYAALLSEMGHHSSVREILESWEYEKTEAYFELLMETYVELNKYRSAIKIAEQGENVASLGLLKARALMGLGQREEAEAQLKSLIDSNPDFVAAQVVLARLEMFDGRVDSATTRVRNVLAKDANNVEANITLADIKSSLGKLEEAESELTKALSLQPTTDVMLPARAAILERLSYILTRLGRTNEAFIYTKLLSEAFPGAFEVSEAYEEAFASFRDGKLDDAKQKVSAIIADYPQHPPSKQLLGVIEYLQGNVEESSKILSGSVDPEVANPLTTHIYASASMQLQDPEKVIEILSPVIADTQVPQTIALYGNALAALGNLKEAEKAFTRVLTLDPSKYRVHLALAALYSLPELENAEKEKQHIADAYKQAPEDPQVLVSAVRSELKYKGEDATLAFVKDAVKARPKSHDVRLVAGYFKASTGAFGDAYEQFKQAEDNAASDDQRYTAIVESARAKIAQSEKKTAEALFMRAVDLQPNKELAYAGLYSLLRDRQSEVDARRTLVAMAGARGKIPAAKVMIRQAVLSGKPDLAREMLNPLLDSDPASSSELDLLSVDVSYAQAVRALADARHKDARTYIAPVLSAQPNALRTLAFLVDLETKTGAVEEAKKVMSQLEDAHPNFPGKPILKGDIAAVESNWSVARDYYKRAWDAGQSNLAGEKLFLTLTRLGDRAGQAAHLDVWLKASPDSLPANLYSAIASQEKGDNVAAARGYEKVLLVDTDNVTALNNLGWLYFERQDARSLGLLERAANLAPENPAVLDSYGWVLVETGQVEKGLPFLEKAAKLAPGIEEIQKHLESARARR